jgi:C-terminal domain 6 of the ABC-three component (ABC-3C) systems
MPLKTVALPAVAPPSGTLPPDVAAAGLAVPAIERLRIMSPSQWEDFILEWAHSIKTTYASVERCAGAGDMGRDVVGYVQQGAASPWDNFQCKHYDHALTPGDIWVELGKLCYYTHVGEYSVPRAYSFVAPRGTGNKLSKLLREPDALRRGLLEEWDRHCKKGIVSTDEIPLDDGLRKHIEAFDFSRIRGASPLTIIEQHRATQWHAARFGGGLPVRPPAPTPPSALGANEATYVRALLDAYEERIGSTIASPDNVQDADLTTHFSRSRREFYSAEALREFSRDNVPSGTFDQLLDEVHDGVVDVVDAQHRDAVERILQTVRQAKALQLTANALVPRVTTTDRGGMCHQLANDQRVRWRR